jgi:hypothetical protein
MFGAGSAPSIVAKNKESRICFTDREGLPKLQFNQKFVHS